MMPASTIIIKPNTNMKNNNNEQSAKTKPWKLVWSDEFDGDTLNSAYWNRQEVEAGTFNEEWQRYTDSPKNAYIENNCLVIKAIHESTEHGSNQYTSARLNTANKFAFKYGKIVASIKLPKGKGIWPAFWMLGANLDENGGDTPWPQSGEIDILELYGTKNDAAIEANLHYTDNEGKHAQMGAKTFKLNEGIFADEFHVFELLWTEKEVEWYVDGEKYASIPIDSNEMSEFHNEFFLLLNIAVGGKWAGYPGSTSEFPQYMYVDWIKVYQQ